MRACVRACVRAGKQGAHTDRGGVGGANLTVAAFPKIGNAVPHLKRLLGDLIEQLLRLTRQRLIPRCCGRRCSGRVICVQRRLHVFQLRKRHATALSLVKVNALGTVRPLRYPQSGHGDLPAVPMKVRT